jgi:hypothetical protein
MKKFLPTLLILIIATGSILYSQISTAKPVQEVKKKFTYARVIHKWYNGQIRDGYEYATYALGKNVSASVEKSVAGKPIDAALEVMGADGWELVTTEVNYLDLEGEFIYNFKKEIR